MLPVEAVALRMCPAALRGWVAEWVAKWVAKWVAEWVDGCPGWLASSQGAPQPRD